LLPFVARRAALEPSIPAETGGSWMEGEMAIN